MHYLYETTAIVGVSVLLYIQTLNGNFVFDDVEAIIKNKDTKNENPIENVFFNDFWGARIISNLSHKSYRPITVLSFRLNNFLSGDVRPDPYYYHAVNICLYATLCVLYLHIFNVFFESSVLPNPAFWTTLLFTVHPIHVESVAAIVGRAELLCANFHGISFLLYHKCIRRDANNKMKVIYFMGAILFATIAMFSKETGITVLGFCAMYDIIYSSTTLKDLLMLKKYKTSIWFLLLRLFFLSLIAFTLLYVRWWIMGFRSPKFQPMDNPASFSKDLLTRTLTHHYVYALNLLLLIWPQWLCFDWAMGCIPLMTSVFDVRFCVIGIFWCLWIMTVYKLFLLKNREILLAFCLLVISFLPASNILRVGFVIAERTLLLPSAGFCMLVSIGAQKLGQRHIYVTHCCFIGLLAVFILKTTIRNTEWLTEEKLFTSALSVCPNNAKVHYNIAKVAADKGNVKLAEAEYRKAIRLYPEYDQAMNNLANILRDFGKYNDAEFLLQKAVEIRPDFAAAWMNLGIVLSNKKKLKESEYCYMRALRIRPKYSDCFYNLGNLYLDQKRNGDAIKSWKTAIQLRSDHTVAWSNLLVLLDSIGRIEEAIISGFQAISILPNEAVLHFSLANSLGKAQRWREAEDHFLIAIRLNPNNALYYSNLGVLYHRWNKLYEAKNYYRIALRLDPHLKSAQENLLKVSKTV